MEPEIRRKIEETVIDILSNADLEEATEFKVRVAASDRLGIDLSEPDFKTLVRNAVETFLVSPPAPAPRIVHKEASDSGGRLICKLSEKRNVVVHDFRGKTLVSIREFYRKDGKQLPSAKGIGLPVEQWFLFKQNVPVIEEAIRKMESKLRPEVDAKQTEDVPSVDINVPHERHIEVDRFDGKNYSCWEHQMVLLLKQLKIAYVLYEPCPSIPVGSESSTEEITQAKAAEQKWKDDDYICFRNILSSLSDHLFHLYSSKKTMTAKELWEELKLVYLCEEYGTNRSQVKKYIEFQMVEERSIVEQVQEINNIADSIVAAGMAVEEKFHVSVVISKLPPSWKDICVKLMCEEYLPFWMLMNRLGVEEEMRNRGKQKMHDPERHHPPDNDVSRNAHPKPTHYSHSRKRELQTDCKVVCHACGRKGHIASHCRSKTWRRDKDFAEKRNTDNGPLPGSTEMSTADGVANS